MWELLGMPVGTQHIISPFREEKLPSCSFYEYNNQMHLKDWGTGYTYTWYAAAVILGKLNDVLTRYVHTPQVITTTLRYVTYKIAKRDFNEDDIKFWAPSPIRLISAYNVYPINAYATYENDVLAYTTRAYKYHYAFIHDSCVKLYAPFNQPKWLGNVRAETVSRPLIIGYNDKPKILCTSLKDAATLTTLTRGKYIGYSYQSEKYTPLLLEPNTIAYIADNDATGLTSAKIIAHKFNIPVFIFQQAKDVYQAVKDGYTLSDLTKILDVQL